MSEFAEGIISEDIIITREPQLFYLLQIMNWIRHANISEVKITTRFIYIFLHHETPKLSH